ncbi:hypothetical protein AVEN_36380-1 [Araneus ventricosus]|uniref:Peptidase aspartic putative domain-containing protein n=1 Tax=Araneus ventricosus TaxID=182803 RepID=A0A4Y2RNB1_ARAVE|nr:hypothetical protein AVEN_36380-1 [Araneus ventricosus]
MFDIEDNLGPIDILIGADVAGRLFTGKRRVLSSGLVALESYLGWIIMRKTNLLSEKEDTAMMKLNQDGRYEVSLPWKGDHLPLPSNKEIAMKRLETSTRKLHHENLFTAYDDVFKEWASLGIIENDPVESSSRHHEHYLPHRPVVKQQGTTKSCPVKTITIPRLELLAATVGARLCRSVLSALQWDNVDTHYWTDSTTVLGWIQREELWSVFVNNRVQEIRKLTDPTLWKHLPEAQNPADLPSKGCSAHQLSCSRWWEGPKWLLQTQENWPVTKPVFDEQSVLKERRKTNSTSKSLPFVCSLNQTENNESSSKDKKKTPLVDTNIIFQVMIGCFGWLLG